MSLTKCGAEFDLAITCDLSSKEMTQLAIEIRTPCMLFKSLREHPKLSHCANIQT